MSKNKTKSRKIEPEKKRISRKTVIAIGIVLVVCIIAAAGVILLKMGPISPAPSGTATNSFTTAGAYYCTSVDLALAQNVSSLTPIIQSNRAGILVELGRNDEAIDAADVAIDAQGNLTTLKSIAWYWKARALQALNRAAEAAAAFANASALDPTHQSIPDHL